MVCTPKECRMLFSDAITHLFAPSMYNYVPDLPLKDIIEYMNDINIDIRQSDLVKPNGNITQRLYESIVMYITNAELEGIADDSLYQVVLYKKMYTIMTKIGYSNFKLKDMNPDSRRLINILSYFVNFSMYRDTKKHIYEKMQRMKEENKVLQEEYEKKINNKKKEIQGIRIKITERDKNKKELEASLLELDNELKDIIKVQRNLVNGTESLKGERDELSDKLNSYQLLIMNLKQDIECLKTQVVSDPTKLVFLLKEMKELLNKETESLKYLENENSNFNNRITFLLKSKDELKTLLGKASICRNIINEIEEIELCISETDAKIKSVESAINASRIRLNYIVRQISHIETKIFNLQETDKKCSDEIYGKMDKLKCDYTDISDKRHKTQNVIENNIKKCKKLEYEIVKIRNEHEFYVNDVVNLINNIKDAQTIFFNDIRKNLQ